MKYRFQIQVRREQTSSKRLTVAVCVCVFVFKKEMVRNNKIAMACLFFFFEKPTNKILFCGLTTETGPKYIKIFYPIICFDQLTTILKIQSWSS